MEEQEKKSLIELKYKVLLERIKKVESDLKNISIFINYQSEINSLKVIEQQYKKMYKAILKNGEFDKYEEVENTIIAEIAKIEARIDRDIYRISSRFEEYMKSIEQSENYKNFHGIDIELEKLNSLKFFLVRCEPYHTQTQQNDLKQKIRELRFNVLMRRQIEQMVYEPQAKESRLNQYEDGEQEYFISRVKEMIMNVEDSVLVGYDVEQIMKDNILANHLIFKILEKDIAINPQKYIGLLQAPIFNPHLCNIANNPFEEKIPYIEAGIDDLSIEEICFNRLKKRKNADKLHLKRSNVNLFLLKAVLHSVIGEENTTIIECNNIFSRFGFGCRPIVFTEGQELIRILYSKVKDDIKPKQKDTSRTNGQYCSIYIDTDTYEFNPKEESFLTNAELKKILENNSSEIGTLMFYRYYSDDEDGLINQELTLKGMEEIISKRAKILEYITEGEENDWVRLPLLKMRKPFKYVEIPKHISYCNDNYGHEWTSRKSVTFDYRPLWKAYESDFKAIGLRVKPKQYFSVYSNYCGQAFSACINLDDIADLPIDFEKIYILTEEDMKNVQKIEEIEEIVLGEEER